MSRPSAGQARAGAVIVQKDLVFLSKHETSDIGAPAGLARAAGCFFAAVF